MILHTLTLKVLNCTFKVDLQSANKHTVVADKKKVCKRERAIRVSEKLNAKASVMQAA